MEKEWRELDGFPNYQVSNWAEFVNARTSREVRPSRNQLGHSKITLIQNRQQVTRSVAQLVAQTFLGPPDPPHFDTVIHLDGQLMNCYADNLLWRPKWFAMRFHKQFYLDRFHEYDVKLIDVETGDMYASVKEVCVKNGLYYADVVKSYVEETHTPLTFQEFRRA